MAVPKKRTSTAKKRIRKNIWKKKIYFSIVKSYSLAKFRSFSSGNEHPKPKGFLGNKQTNNQVFE
uniref:Large ribosomal subunit protein bL32c n=2 Tax=Eriachne TaxID=66023 RepID=A0A481ZSA5_9POAL|nr:ribosomal protein L32 [Eriachne avenacea]YP_009583559.1 ribosomal protein L32 [Eriachne melicacea]QBL03103.1 ribosomal protein L32 [Eriachne avenacea]QBL03186.1 ribosomal protein L32 [Eriachne avenacea]QBL04348.1 ribosomal protein L32 [Eriachne melicacea]QBL04431.1 ribosomal protein L32 [Eriachne melicacea]QBL04514.1 ribosomal protein L32 [Eriachne melicacea]